MFLATFVLKDKLSIIDFVVNLGRKYDMTNYMYRL